MSVICARDFKKRRKQSAGGIAQFNDRKASGVRRKEKIKIAERIAQGGAFGVEAKLYILQD